ncbi:hypothetical protein BLNAU_8417 [Blattamonas nauphoetae]|uniref:Uncharacterized protein n=1 Tax=Blattamonas nauphoetae TaxID=2049346 RepID=A0ABQ9XYK9_9EUKA|nr:hypothetical protein BLNAU_8417 [Blattamonas nauphoetae]
MLKSSSTTTPCSDLSPSITRANADFPVNTQEASSDLQTLNEKLTEENKRLHERILELEQDCLNLKVELDTVSQKTAQTEQTRQSQRKAFLSIVSSLNDSSVVSALEFLNFMFSPCYCQFSEHLLRAGLFTRLFTVVPPLSSHPAKPLFYPDLLSLLSNALSPKSPDLTFQNVILPFSPYLLPIYKRFPSYRPFHTLLKLLERLLHQLSFHPPTSEWVRSHSVPMMFVSGLSLVEHERTRFRIVADLESHLLFLKRRDAKAERNRGLVMECMSSEGLEDEFEELFFFFTKYEWDENSFFRRGVCTPKSICMLLGWNFLKPSS